MFQNMINVPKSFEDALVRSAEEEEKSAIGEMKKLQAFFLLNAEVARKSAAKTTNQIGHGVHTGEACAFEAASGYVSLALGRLGY